MRFDKTPEPSQLIVEEPKIPVINFGFKIINKTVFYFFYRIVLIASTVTLFLCYFVLFTFIL